MYRSAFCSWHFSCSCQAINTISVEVVGDCSMKYFNFYFKYQVFCPSLWGVLFHLHSGEVKFLSAEDHRPAWVCNRSTWCYCCQCRTEFPQLLHTARCLAWLWVTAGQPCECWGRQFSLNWSGCHSGKVWGRYEAEKKVKKNPKKP